jgi:hypothetical protein
LDVLFCFEDRTGQTRLPDNTYQRTDFDFVVIGHRDGNGAVPLSFLHDDVTSLLTHFFKTMLRQDFAKFPA